MVHLHQTAFFVLAVAILLFLNSHLLHVLNIVAAHQLKIADMHNHKFNKKLTITYNLLAQRILISCTERATVLKLTTILNPSTKKTH